MNKLIRKAVCLKYICWSVHCICTQYLTRRKKTSFQTWISCFSIAVMNSYSYLFTHTLPEMLLFRKSIAKIKRKLAKIHSETIASVDHTRFHSQMTKLKCLYRFEMFIQGAEHAQLLLRSNVLNRCRTAKRRMSESTFNRAPLIIRLRNVCTQFRYDASHFQWNWFF